MSRRLALIVGNSRYDDPGLARLGAPDVDVRELGQALRSADIGQFHEVVQLVNQSSSTVRRAIAELFHLKRREDLVVLYFSGHGIRDDQGQLYLATRDTERSLLSATAIEASFISGQMDRSGSRRQVLILDCCHSGAFGGKNAPLGTSIGTAAAFEGVGFGRVVLTATDATQYAWEGDRVIGEAEPSLFTNFLVLGLQSGAADLNGDGAITIDELYEYAFDEVVNATSKQVPGKWAFKQQGEIVIARNPRGVHTSILPDALQEKINSPIIERQLEAIRDLAVILRGQHRTRAIAARAALDRLASSGTVDVAHAARAVLAKHPTSGLDLEQQGEPITPSGGARRTTAPRSGALIPRWRHWKRAALVLAVCAFALLAAPVLWDAARNTLVQVPRPPQPGSATATTGFVAPAPAGDSPAASKPDSKIEPDATKPSPAAGNDPEAGRANTGSSRPPGGGGTQKPPSITRGTQSSATKAGTSSPGSASPNEVPVAKEDGPSGATANPPEPRPATPAREDREAVLTVFQRYREAYSKKDLDGIRILYPTVRPNLFGRGARDCSSFDLQLADTPKVDFRSPDSAQIWVLISYVCFPKSKRPPDRQGPFRELFEFRKQGSGWVIEGHLGQLGK